MLTTMLEKLSAIFLTVVPNVTPLVVVLHDLEIFAYGPTIMAGRTQ
jgi:hypothetical protein